MKYIIPISVLLLTIVIATVVAGRNRPVSGWEIPRKQKTVQEASLDEHFRVRAESSRKIVDYIKSLRKPQILGEKKQRIKVKIRPKIESTKLEAAQLQQPGVYISLRNRDVNATSTKPRVDNTEAITSWCLFGKCL